MSIEIQNHVFGFYFADVSQRYSHSDLWLPTWLARAGYNAFKPAYYQNVRFQFDTPYHLVDFLANLDHTSLRLLRYISVKAYPFHVRLPGEESPTTFQISNILTLFPGLRLSVLEVQVVHGEIRAEPDLQPGDITYNEVEHLIQSDGFKQLRYRFQHSGWMLPATYEDYPEDGNGKPTKPSHRNIQPNFWRASIQERDGLNSDAEVEAFEYQQGGRHVVHEWFYDFTDYDSGGEAKSEPGVGCLVGSHATEPVDVVNGRLDGNEVRVTRGNGIDYVQSGKSTKDAEIRLQKLLKQFTWSEIKDQGFVLADTGPKSGSVLH